MPILPTLKGVFIRLAEFNPEKAREEWWEGACKGYSGWHLPDRISPTRRAIASP